MKLAMRSSRLKRRSCSAIMRIRGGRSLPRGGLYAPDCVHVKMFLYFSFFLLAPIHVCFVVL